MNGIMRFHHHYKLQVREIPLFHGDQWEATVPSLLGLAPEDQMPGALQGVDKDGNLLRSKKPQMLLPFPCLDVLDVFRLMQHQQIVVLLGSAGFMSCFFWRPQWTVKMCCRRRTRRCTI